MVGNGENQQNPSSLFDVPKDQQLMSTFQPLTIQFGNTATNQSHSHRWSQEQENDEKIQNYRFLVEQKTLTTKSEKK